MSLGPGYDPRGSGRARRAGQVVQALLGPGGQGAAGTINVVKLAGGESTGKVLASVANTSTITIDTIGLTLWQCPTGVTSVFAECFGRGGNGTAYGGGAGEYAAKTISVTAGTFYSVFVGDPSLGSTSTAFNSASVVAKPGGDAAVGSSGAGGTGGTGTTLFDGGAGSNPNVTGDGGGGAGGSSGSEAGAGNTPSNASGPAGATGGVAVGTGGAGGNGGTSSKGFPGQVPGGGGGGCSKLFPGGVGAFGAHGRVKLTYTVAGTVTEWVDVSSLAAASVSNSDGSLTISPTTGAVVASLNTGYANTWTAVQTFQAPASGNAAIFKAGATPGNIIVLQGVASMGSAAFIQYDGVSSTAAVRHQATIDAFVKDNTDATRKYGLILSGWDSVAQRQILQCFADGAAPNIGFLGAHAAPQQTGDIGNALVTFGLMSGTPTLAGSSLTGLVVPFTTKDNTGLTATTTSGQNVSATAPSDGNKHQYKIGAYVSITAIVAGIGNLVIGVAFTDENSNSRNIQFYDSTTFIQNLVSAKFYTFPDLTIRVKEGTTITISATFTGTSITYDFGGSILQVN